MRLGAELCDGLGDERRVDADDDGEHGARLREGLDRQRIAHVVATAATPLLRNRDTEQASRGSLSHDLQRKCVSLVDLGRCACDALGGKRPNLFLKRPLIVGQFESHGMNLPRFPRLVLGFSISGLSLLQGVQELSPDPLVSCKAGAAKQPVASISKLSQPLDRSNT